MSEEFRYAGFISKGKYYEYYSSDEDKQQFEHFMATLTDDERKLIEVSKRNHKKSDRLWRHGGYGVGTYNAVVCNICNKIITTYDIKHYITKTAKREINEHMKRHLLKKDFGGE
ncbi:MAG: hypothetical protein QXF41_02025 [Candidatus Micrarchaeaceae archaeon]